MRFFFSSDGIKIHKRRAEPLETPDWVPVNLLEQYVAMKPEWMHHPRRHCRGVDTGKFFGTGDAVWICDGCPVLVPCRDYAIEQGSQLSGVWGGLTEADRADIRRRELW